MLERLHRGHPERSNLFLLVLNEVGLGGQKSCPDWANKMKQPTVSVAAQFGTKLGTTKVQLGAQRTGSADSAEHETCRFPKKLKNPQ
jgi:hypothetical protein